ncbi:hypothetical protein [Streptomyces fuscigenes]|uniref:hypothetical protein n=1 Tax=Streptomyces fuscigenes TaxID=1528880 RepID=UPI001F425110|nr:hypothetical protein [Streptomyces fuscigenes]MCF3960304.1 hypothetical protein [Streptomyces fuscigenes]
MSFFSGIGVFGIASALLVVLWFGTKDNENAKVGPLNWWACVLLSLLAGAAFNAAGTPFDLISSLVNDLVGLIGAFAPELTMPALALILALLAVFKKWSRRGISYLVVFFTYVASGAGGPWAVLSKRIAAAVHGMAS